MRLAATILFCSVALASAGYNYLPVPTKQGDFTQGNGQWNAYGAYLVWGPRSAVVTYTNVYSVGFDGINDVVTNNSLTACNYTNALTVLAWVYYDATCPDLGNIVARYDYGTGNRVWLFRRRAAPSLEFLLSGVGTSVSKIQSVSYGSTSGWHHVGFTFTNDVLNIYVDGLIRPVTTSSESVVTFLYSAPTVPVTFGHVLNNGTPAFPFKGLVDEVKMWNRALSSAEVLSVYNSGTPDDSGSPDNWWRMGDGDTYPTLLDGIGGKSATMVNQSATNIVTVVP
jgi:hypothetical protein